MGTVPYNKRSTSRAFESYFSNWEKENLAQVFSNTKKPARGHCASLYQITDQRMLKRRWNKSLETGVVYRYGELPEEWSDNSLEVGSSLFSGLYRIGSRHSALTHLGRKFVWKKKYWCTEKLNQWLDAFRPECVFLSFSDDFFIPEIALYAAKRYDIPIVSSIGDDYYFNTRKTLNPIYRIYKSAYKKLIQKVFRHPGSAIYIGDKIRDQYNQAFGLKGETVYLTSEIERRKFRPINTTHPSIVYFGNISMGRNVSLNEIGLALGRIDPAYKLDVYSNSGEELAKVFAGNPNVCFRGSISYVEVQKKTLESDLVVLVEGFSKEAIESTRYSLSTKTADSLSSGSNAFVYGSMECGLIEYMAQTGGAMVCSDPDQLEDCLRTMLFDQDYQQKAYYAAKAAAEKNHVLANSTAIFEGVVRRVIKEYKNGTEG